MKIAVLMTCHNRREKTMLCLNSLRDSVTRFRCKELSDAEFHIFLVDDGSTDGTSEAVREYAKEVACQGQQRWIIHLIQGNGNLFWARGMALAWREALKYEKLTKVPTASFSFNDFLWLNDDVVLRAGALVDVYEDWKKCGNPYGVIVGACSEDIGCMISTYGATDKRDKRLIPSGAPQRASGWFNGNIVFIPHETYEKVGIISDEYSHGHADYDYAERLKDAGIPFFCSSQCVGVCHRDFNEKMAVKSRWGRLAVLWHPGSLNLRDLWVFRSKYYGIPRAILSCLHAIIIRLKG